MSVVNEFSLSGWLSKFLSRRNLDVPDQRPLYEYQVSFAEYEELKAKLQQQAHDRTLPNHKGNYAAFVLFCAEWYRREYQEGWSWKPIWDALQFTIEAQALAKAVPIGLEGFWKRPIRFYESDRRNFLGSLFSEGGLPFLVLQQPESRFQVLFSKILKNYDRAEGLGESTHQLVLMLIDKINLPQVFSEESSIELIAAMADQLVSLVRLYDLDGKSDPIAELDASNPRWREGFPIPLDESTGTDLLNGLLQSASREQKARRQASKEWRCVQYLPGDQTDLILVNLSLPSQLVFPLLSTPTSARFEIALYEGDYQLANLGTGYAALEGNMAKVALRQRQIKCSRRYPQHELSIVALGGGLILGSLPVDRSQVGIGEVPIGLEATDLGLQVCGQASFNSKAEKIQILLPSQTRYEVAVGQVTEVQSLFGCQVIEVAGTITLFDSNNETFRIRTGSSAADGVQIGLRGRTLEWPCRPAQTFLGVPRIDLGVSGKSDLSVDALLYLSGTPFDQCRIQERLGSHYLSFRNKQGETLLRRKVGILPDDLQILLKCGDRADQGSVIIRSSRTCLVQLVDDGVGCNKVKLQDGTELKLKTNGNPPQSVKIALTPNLASDPIVVEVPFPAAGILAFDKDQKQLQRSLAVSDLLGSRLYLFSVQGRLTSYELTLRLAGGRDCHAQYEWRYRVSEKPIEISLFNIKEQIENLLSIKDGIDQVVELRITGGRKEEVYRIRRHSSALELDRERGVIRFSSLVRIGDKSPKLAIMLLAEPERRSMALTSRMSQGVETNEFELPAFVDRNGPWLVVPERGSEVSCRPLFVHGTMPQTDPTQEIRSLQKAVVAFSPQVGHSVFDGVLTAMANDPAHSGWQFMRTLYDQYGYLPLATFEIWRALVKHPGALGMALFKFEMDTELLLRLEAEFPVFWEFISIDVIRTAGLRFKSLLSSKGLPDPALSGLMQRMYERLASVYSVYGAEVMLWLVAGQRPTVIPESMMMGIVNRWYQELIRDRSADSWPAYGAGTLKRWYQEHSTPLALNQDMDYRNSVVYLPVFAAAVAAGEASISDVFRENSDSVFFLRQVRDFDPKWFDSVYGYCLLSYLLSKN